MHTGKPQLLASLFDIEIRIGEILLNQLDELPHEKIVHALCLLHGLSTQGFQILTGRAQGFSQTFPLLQQVNDTQLDDIDVEWLRDIGIGTLRQTIHTLAVLAQGGQQNHGDMAEGNVGLHLLAKLIPIHLGHQHIGQDQSDRL